MMARPELDLVPLSQFSERLAQGWTMVSGYPLEPDDYVVTMAPPTWPQPKRNKVAGAISAVVERRKTLSKRRKRREDEYA